MTDDETDKAEDIVKGMKKNTSDLKKRYGKDWKSVMYATANKMAKEETDIQELSKRTLSSYVAKGDRSYDHLNTTSYKKFRDAEQADKYHKGAGKKFTKAGIKLGQKADKRAKYLNKADEKIAKEETNIQELSKRVLANYVGKASKDAASQSFDAGVKMSDKNAVKELIKKNNKAQNRLKGIGKAAKKLGEEQMKDDYKDDDYKDKERKKKASKMIRNARRKKQADRDEYMDEGTIKGLERRQTKIEQDNARKRMKKIRKKDARISKYFS
jgi:hypothetical protein